MEKLQHTGSFFLATGWWYPRVMDAATLISFTGTLEKWAALSDAEKATFKQVVRNQASFDQEASSGKMNDARKELHRQNTERMQEFLKKKKSDSHRIPGWAADPNGKMPGGSSQRARGGRPRGAYGRHPRGVKVPPAVEKAMRWAVKHPRTAAAGAVGLYGATATGAHAHIKGMNRTSAEKRKEVNQAAKHGGPFTQYAANNPGKAGALIGALSGAVGGAASMASHQKGKNPVYGYAGGALGTILGSLILDKQLGDRARAKAKLKGPQKPAMTTEEKNRKRREEYARKPKAPSVSKPTTLKTVKIPKMPKAA